MNDLDELRRAPRWLDAACARRNMGGRGGRREQGGGRRVPQFTASGLVLDWYVTPSKITTVDDAGTPRISALVDSGPSAVNLAQATIGQRPEYVATGLNGHPGAKFSDTRGDLLRTAAGPTIAAGPLTVYAWLTAPALTMGSRMVVDVQTGRLAVIPLSATGGIGAAVVDSTSTTRSFGLASTGDQSLVYTLVAGTNTASLHRNGALVGSVIYASTGLGGAYTFGGVFSGAATNSIAATVGRVRIYTGAHDAATRAQNLAAGAALYGFGAS